MVRFENASDSAFARPAAALVGALLVLISGSCSEHVPSAQLIANAVDRVNAIGLLGDAAKEMQRVLDARPDTLDAPTRALIGRAITHAIDRDAMTLGEEIYWLGEMERLDLLDESDSAWWVSTHLWTESPAIRIQLLRIIARRSHARALAVEWLAVLDRARTECSMEDAEQAALCQCMMFMRGRGWSEEEAMGYLFSSRAVLRQQALIDAVRIGWLPDALMARTSEIPAIVAIKRGLLGQGDSTEHVLASGSLVGVESLGRIAGGVIEMYHRTVMRGDRNGLGGAIREYGPSICRSIDIDAAIRKEFSPDLSIVLQAMVLRCCQIAGDLQPIPDGGWAERVVFEWNVYSAHLGLW